MQSPVADVTVQAWHAYTPLDHETWGTLYRRRMTALEYQASAAFLDGARTIGLDAEAIPDLATVNAKLVTRTGWRAVPVRGFLPAAEFFRSLASRRFPTTVTIRSPGELEYTPAPDIFHDVFGHVPLHAVPAFADFLAEFGALASQTHDPERTVKMARLFWFTVEFGLIRERGVFRVYGSGLISSSAEAEHALTGGAELRRFEIESVMNQPFEIDRLQSVLYWIEDFRELSEALGRCRR